jgi:uncharacterized membrane protein YfcA
MRFLPEAWMEALSPEVWFLLAMVAALAGFVDAIAGGGGLLALPALLAAGLPPLQALATNKLQGSFGTLTATVHHVRHGGLKLRALWPAVLLTFIGAASGTVCVQVLPNTLLEQLVPVLLIGFGVGFYDGFFGPGTGSFFALGFVLLLGWNLRRATGGTKLLNFTSNVASLLFFALGGHVLWGLGLVMGLAQVAGAWAGSHMVLRHGSRIVRPLLVLVCLALSLKLLLGA